MAFQQAAVLHTDNTVVDNSGTADIRRLLDTWTTYGITTIQNATQGSNAERRWDPETAADVVTSNASSQTDGKGFAIPTADMDPGVAGCVAILVEQTLTIDFSVNFFGQGAGSAGANDVWTPRASIWKWNTSTDTATLIIGGSGSTVSNSALFAYGPVLKAGQVTLSVPLTTFGANEVLLVVTGGNLATGAGLLGGARTFAIRLDQAASPIKLTFATQGLRKRCTVSPTGSTTPVSSVIRSPKKVFAGSSTPNSALVRSPKKMLAGSSTPTSVVIRTASKIFSGSSNPAGSLIRIPTRILSGSYTPTSSLTKKPSKIFSSSSTPTGSLTRQPFRIFSGSLGSNGSLLKKPSKFFTGSETPTGSLKRSPTKVLSGTLTPGPSSIIFRAVKLLSGSTTPNSALARKASKFFSGSSTPSGQLLREPKKYFEGSITPGPSSLVRQPVKLLESAVTFTSEIRSLLTKNFRSDLPLTSDVYKLVSKYYQGATTPTGQVTKTPKKFFSGVIAGEGGSSIVRRIRRLIVDD